MGARRPSYKCKKRVFVGNRFKNNLPRNENPDLSNGNCKEQAKMSRPRPGPSTAGSTGPLLTSRSSKKLTLAEDPTNRVKIRNSSIGGPTYRIMNIVLAFEEIERCLRCATCSGTVKIMEESKCGWGSKFVIECEKCLEVGAFRSSEVCEDTQNAYEVNRRSVFAMRNLGLGLAGLETFCGVMDLPPPVKQSTYTLINNRIMQAVIDVAEESMSMACNEEITQSDNPSARQVAVSGDGTWMKRGFSSRHGVCTAIGVETGKVIDIEVLSSYCHSCEVWSKRKNTKEYDIWLQTHKSNCQANHTGSAGSMEVEGMQRIFSRSEKKHNAQYVTYVGDGDAKTYQSIAKIQPYGPDVKVSKIECVGHIQKRMGTKLRKIKDEYRGKKLSDGKPISGKGRLTPAVIKTLTTYYGNAIRANKDSPAEMRRAIWAIWMHKISCDEKPNHVFCPSGDDSWCPYQKAVALGTEGSYKHKNNIPPAIMEAIKPAFKDLSAPDLLERCIGGLTQNSNESINNLIWKINPKTSFSGHKVVKIAAYHAVAVFNDGNKAKLKIIIIYY